MGEIIIKKAAESDLDTLLEQRWISLNSMFERPDDADLQKLREATEDFYKESFETGNMSSYMVYENNKFIGSGAIKFYTVMPTYENPTGKRAYIMNIFVVPEKRGNGIAKKIVEHLLNEAKEKKVNEVILEATSDGQKLYEKEEFFYADNTMKKRLI